MIEVSGLSKTYNEGETWAVKNVSFSLKEGEVGCLIGTSGCGKTTTLKMINRLVEPTKGNLIVGNKGPQDTGPVEWRRGIGYVIQKAGLMPHLTVKDNISLLSRVMKKDKDFIESRVKELMDIIKLPYSQFSSRFPGELSGGQQQRVGIARALMEDPPVLLMDEPFGALDPITRKSLHEELLEMNKVLRKTILIVTHDISEAFKLADNTILMDKGNIVQMGSKSVFLENPANSFVSNFIKGGLDV